MGSIQVQVPQRPAAEFDTPEHNRHLARMTQTKAPPSSGQVNQPRPNELMQQQARYDLD